MRIAQVVGTYPPYRGGTGRIAEEYTTRLQARGHEVHVFTAARGAGRQIETPFVHRLRGLRVGNAALVPTLFRRLHGFDLVHLHYPFFGGAEVALIRRLLHGSQPLVMTYHMDATAGGLKGAIFDLHARLVLPRVAARADRVFVSSLDYAKASALARLDGVMRRVEVHPFGVDLDRFHPGPEPDLKASLEIPADVPVLLFVGTLDAAHHFKGLPVLFEALAGLRDRRWRLVVAGDGPLRPAFEQLAIRHRIDSNVSFVGDAPDPLLTRYYRLADVHVFPSTGAAEAFGLVVMEAAASGVPSIASSLPGVRTVVSDGETGLHVSPGDPVTLRAAIGKLLASPDLRAGLGHRARVEAQRTFAWPPLIDALERTYASLVRG